MSLSVLRALRVDHRVPIYGPSAALDHHPTALFGNGIPINRGTMTLVDHQIRFCGLSATLDDC